MEIPHTVTARPDTGLWNAKIGIWLFLASEVMLFGGLFSSYIFLRIGADRPWPIGELQWIPGAINTAVLILSSVTVVLAWFNLKMRNYGKYKFFMSITLLCAVAFMGIKAVEYKKKFSHYQITLKDGSIVNGHHLESALSYSGVTQVSIDFAAGGDPDLSFLESANPSPVFTNAAGTPVTLNSSYLAQEKAIREKAGGGQSIVLTSSVPFSVALDRGLVSDAGDDSASMTGGVSITGEKVDDYVSVEADEIDLRMADDYNDSLLFAHLPEGVVSDFKLHMIEATKEYSGALLNPGFGGTPKEFDPDSLHFSKDGKYSAEGARRILMMKLGGAAGGHGGADPAGTDYGASEGGYGHHPLVKIPHEEVRFASNWGPSKNTYYGIYFVLTGLHGLHVVGGALVLAYMFFTGREMYRKEPEHLANRVEVAGLFWHFVDLIWIFLFPLLYLL